MPKPKKNSKETTPAICGVCVKPIDRAAVEAALKGKTELRHECGRVLVKGPLG